MFQGENNDSRYNTLVGEFLIEGLAEVPAGNEILVRLDLDLNGILKVTATERATGLAKHVVIDNAMERFRKQKRSDAVDRLEAILGGDHCRSSSPAKSLLSRSQKTTMPCASQPAEAPPRCARPSNAADALATQAKRVLADRQRSGRRRAARPCSPSSMRLSRGMTSPESRTILRKVEDLVFYLQDA